MQELFEKGKPLAKYVGGAEEGISRKIDRLLDRARKEKLPEAKPMDRRCLLFSEFWCPDCLVMLASLRYIQELLPQLEIRVLSREGYLDILSEHSVDGKARIPLLLVLDDEGNTRDYLSEVPSSIQEIKNDPKDHRDYRSGKYMDKLLEALWGMLTG